SHHAWHLFDKRIPLLDSGKDYPILQAIRDTIRANLLVNTKNKHVHPSVEIFGYHPYWVANSNEAYIKEFLTTIAYFAYQLNPSNGSLTNLQKSFSPSTLKESASKAVVTIVNFGASENSRFLGNKTAQQKLITSLVQLMAQQQLD